MSILVKSVKDDKGSRDGVRILVDEHLPEGLNEDVGNVDLWPRELAPSEGLRKMLKEHPERWDDFVKGYMKELGDERDNWISAIIGLVRKGDITLLYSCGDAERNAAKVIRQYIFKTLAEEAEMKAA